MSSNGSGGPSIRLNLSSSNSQSTTTNSSNPHQNATATSNNNANNTTRATKKRRFFTPTEIAPHLADASQVTVLHQVTHISWTYSSVLQQWFGEGSTTMYLVNTAQKYESATIQAMALHGRKSIELTSVEMEALDKKAQKLTSRRTSFIHADPLEHILVKPAATMAIPEDDSTTTLTMTDDVNDDPNRLNADAQCSRGAMGMTNGLRAASIASLQGEVRLSYEKPEALLPKMEGTNSTSFTATGAASGPANSPAPNAQQLKALAASTSTWQRSLQLSSNNNNNNSNGSHDDHDTTPTTSGTARDDLKAHIRQRQTTRAAKRLARVANVLAQASTCPTKGNAAVKCTLRFRIQPHAEEESETTAASGSTSRTYHWGGIHFVTGPTPYIYSSTGIQGDHAGPRTWIPCVDTAAPHHRASHELSMSVTAGLRHGLSIAGGMGEDFGHAQAYLHAPLSKSTPDAARVLGSNLVDFLQRIQKLEDDKLSRQSESSSSSTNNRNLHIIPPDDTAEETPVVLSLDNVHVTSLWASATWAPIPIRSLGFAVGPFRYVEDAEYFGKAAAAAENAMDEDGNDTHEMDQATMDERHAQYVQKARDNGEGIRQAYIAPVYERKHIHKHASRELLPHARLQLRPLTDEQKATLQDLDNTVQFSTVGVPHRALSLMRDILAFSTYRTSSYLQIWIPHAVDGGCTSGALHNCPEVMVNPFLGGAIMDSRLLPPVQMRLPYFHGGRALQFLQARNCVRGWITSSLPLGAGGDDIGNGYIHRLFEALFMSLYERGHGAYGEGGARGGVYFTRRYAANSGLNSINLDFLPVRNMEDVVHMDSLAAVVDDGQNDYLWRSSTNGTESHTAAIDEFNARYLMTKDAVEVVERGTDKDKQVPLPGMGYLGSHLSSTFLSSNASSSSHLGCGAVEMMHPLGGLVYRSMKMDAFRGVVEGRAGTANFVRLVRASFVAAHLSDIGEKTLVLPKKKKKASKESQGERERAREKEEEELLPPFVVCVNEILAKKGLTHTLFTRALQNMCGRHRESLLAGTLVDVERHAEDPRTRKSYVDPEGFPNSYVRAASTMYCRVGVQVETQTRDTGVTTTKSTQCQIYAEPVIVEGGTSFGGPITIRVIENEGQFREYEKDLTIDGSRRDWGSMALHAKAVSTAQAQAQASGSLEAKSTKGSATESKFAGNAFSSHFHGGGFQAIELVRLTNLTPLLWVRVDPSNMYAGRIAVTQPDACLSEQLFHDGDSAAQIEAIRALAERPLAVQGSQRVSVIHGVNVSELPVRVLGDCLRGSPVLHSCLPHTPCVRRHAALAIGQWQNNKGPESKSVVGGDSWLGLDLLKTYFQERFCSNAVVMPTKYSRVIVKHSEAETRGGASSNEGGGNPKNSQEDELYDYLDAIDDEDRTSALEKAEDVETEEDEEYRVRSAVVTAIACIRAQDGQTPTAVIQLMELILESEDAATRGNIISSEDELMTERNFEKTKLNRLKDKGEDIDEMEYIRSPFLSYYSGMLVADTLLALCHINAWPETYTDPATGKIIHASGNHPVTKLMELAQLWVDWELYREKIRSEMEAESMAVIGGNCEDIIGACAIFSLAHLAIFKQCTSKKLENSLANDSPDPATKASYYTNIFNLNPRRNDLVRAAAAQAMTCICCAADRFEVEGSPAVGLLTALEFLLEKISQDDTSPSLKQTLALIMMDACTGKVASMQRVGSIGGRNDLCTSASRFFCGPLGPSHGNDKGSAIVMSTSAGSNPAASAVNDGARRGIKLLNRAGHPKDNSRPETVARVARFATHLWRIINGEPPEPPSKPHNKQLTGVCAYDASLRCSLLCLWQWLWPRGCFAVLQVQSWKNRERSPEYKAMGAHLVMKISDEEKAAAMAEESSLSEISQLVLGEIDRQLWRGEMAGKAYTIFKSAGNSSTTDASAAEQGIGQPLPPIQRDAAFKSGGWIASHAQQRRSLALDGGTAVTKLRLKVGGGAK